MSTSFDFPRYPDAIAAQYRSRGYWIGETIGGMLRRVCNIQPDAIAVIDGHRRVTYRELDQAVDRIANGLATLGVRAGDRVVVQLPNSLEFVEALFGLSRLGAIPVMALPSDRLNEITHICKGTDAVAYWIQDRVFITDYREIAYNVQQAVASLKHVIVVGEPGSYLSHCMLFGEGAPLPEPRSNAAALVMLSGGSTALPKFIVRTHDDYLYSVRRSAEVCGLTHKAVYLCVLPAAHNFTMSSPGILGVIHVGGCIVMQRDPSAASAFPVIAHERVTFTSLVPGLAIAWCETNLQADLSSLEFIQVGGASLSPDQAKRIGSRFGCELQQVFGMTEGMVAYTRRGDTAEHINSTQGIPMSPADEILIVDDDDRPLPNDTAGNLLVRGPYTIRGYLNSPEISAQSFTPDGFYRTGDKVRRRPDGYLVVEGRIKDQVNRGGEKIAAEEVEGHLLECEAVREAAIVGVPDKYLGEAACAFVVAAEGVAGSEAEAVRIRAFIRTRGLAPHKIPDVVRFIPVLPKTTLGKTDKKVLRAIFDQMTVAVAAPLNCRETNVTIPNIKYYEIPTRPTMRRTPVEWQFDSSRAALLIHDMQHYFLRGYESADFVNKLVDRILVIRDQCDALGIPVFYTAQPGDQRAEDRGLLCDFWGPGLSAGLDDVSIVAALAPRAGLDTVLVKHRYSAFSKSDFLERLRSVERNQLIVCGVYAHIGCLVTAVESFMADIAPFFVADALGDFSLEHHQGSLDYVANVCGQVLTTGRLLTQMHEQTRSRSQQRESLEVAR